MKEGGETDERFGVKDNSHVLLFDTNRESSELYIDLKFKL